MRQLTGGCEPVSGGESMAYGPKPAILSRVSIVWFLETGLPEIGLLGLRDQFQFP